MANEDKKPRKLRPYILEDTVNSARKLVTDRYGETLANSLNDGDVIDLAFKILEELERLDPPSK